MPNIPGYLFYLTILLINKSLKISIKNYSHEELFKNQHYIFAIWHQNTFTPFYLYRNKKISMLVSDNKKGNILTYAAKKMTYDTIKISKDQKKSTVRLIRQLNNKQNLIMAVDGPSGPTKTVKNGCQYLNEKTNTKVIGVKVNYNKAISLFWRWDKYLIPLPFSKVTLTFSKAYTSQSDWSELKNDL
jgi:lysophospholipid acyltransferase (LPLAT)-like uncharacterized protein